MINSIINYNYRENNFFKKLLKIRSKNNDNATVHKPIYINRKEEKDNREDNWEHGNTYNNELEIHIRENLKNIFKDDAKNDGNLISRNKQKEEQNWKNKRTLNVQLKTNSKYDLRSLLNKEIHGVEKKSQLLPPRKLGYKSMNIQQIWKPKKEDCEMLQIEPTEKPEEEEWEIIEMESIEKPEEENYEMVKMGKIKKPEEENYEMVKMEKIKKPEEDNYEMVEMEKIKKVHEKTQIQTHSVLNALNFEAKIAAEWKELEDADNKIWTDVTNKTQKLLMNALQSDSDKSTKMESWNSKHKSFTLMRRVKNKADTHCLDDFKNHLFNKIKKKENEESWIGENEMWEVLKYIKKKSDADWNEKLVKSWTQWFRSEIPEIKFEMSMTKV
ncbi:Plasmodium exported protein, unknown function [Plasmodium gonderi]|uniref:Uncharacterized protein n=1 Tax=Plasmodium gonderi TaxID=77519 RepID=A0A1Y1JAT6_PLAGO|nr:Plasmodium exported protein, unknown function [Plasmodium gonderi]GAW79606.1 Plasmodium exported protein, unknown function [Plasmodium gonderi]